MSNKYDRILRDGVKALLPLLLAKLYQVVPERYDLEPGKVHTTLDLEADLLLRLHPDNPSKARALHVEFQVGNEQGMAKRMHEYYTVLSRKYDLKIDQLVIYLNPKKGKTSGRRKYTVKGKLTFQYHVLYLQDVPYEELLRLNVPEAVVLALLGDFGTNDPEEILAKIFSRLQAISANNDRMGEYVVHLKTLSNLREFSSEVHQKIQNMTGITQKILDYALQNPESPYYKEVLAEGLSKGLAEGMAKGLAEAERQIVARMLRSGMSAEASAELSGMPLEKVLEIKSSLEAQA
jgi:predicted transposase YdaD